MSITGKDLYQLSARISRDTYKLLKVKSILEDIPIEQLVDEALRDWHDRQEAENKNPKK